ncbi:7593_t:CDS:1, partial [Funneliformis mosseae]
QQQNLTEPTGNSTFIKVFSDTSSDQVICDPTKSINCITRVEIRAIKDRRNDFRLIKIWLND